MNVTDHSPRQQVGRAVHRWLLASVIAAVASVAVPVLAQETYPARPVKLINNFPPGGPSDILARTVGQVLQERFRHAFVVENRAGASGNIGADAVAKSVADGHTVLFTIDSVLTVNPHIYGKALPFKPADFRPVLIMASSGLMVGVNPATGIQSLKDFIAVGQARGLTLSSGGNGSPGHLAAELFTEAARVKINHIPYKGNTPAVLAVLSGEVNGGVLATPGLLPQVRAGKISALAVTSSQRSTLAPEVPTVAELGLKELQQEVMYLVLVPAATSDAVVQTLQSSILDALNRPDVQTRLRNLDLHVEGQAGEAAVQRLAELSQRYGRVVRATGMKVE